MGIVAAVGDSVHIKVGTPVALMTFGSYAEFTMVLLFFYIFYFFILSLFDVTSDSLFHSSGISNVLINYYISYF